jgi:hypothetical protein
LQAALQSAQTADEPGDQAAAEFPEAPVVGVTLLPGFFSSGVGRAKALSWPTQTHQYIASAMISTSRSKAVSLSQLRVLQFEAAALEIGKYRLYAPADTDVVPKN